MTGLLSDCPARAHASTSAGRDGDRHLVEQPARQLGASAMGAGAPLCRTQGDEVVLRGPFMQAPVSGQSVAAHETSRDGNVSTPMRKTVAVGKSSPFPCEGDFLRERDIEKAPCMKRPAASRKETTACRRGLKRPAAAGHVEKASGSQALDPEGKDLSKPGGKSRKDLLAGSPSLAASSHPNLERKR